MVEVGLSNDQLPVSSEHVLEHEPDLVNECFLLSKFLPVSSPLYHSLFLSLLHYLFLLPLMSTVII